MFDLIKIDNGRENVPDTNAIQRTASVAYTTGTVLYMNAGKAALATGTTMPTFICLSTLKANDGEDLVAAPISKEMLFEVPLSAYSASTIVPGGKVTIGTDGASVTATATSGVATIVDTKGAKAAGDKVLVRFM